MSNSGLVAGGVGRTCVCLVSNEAELIVANWINLPECCSLDEWFEEVSLADDEMLDGSRRRLNAGFRYHLRLGFPYLDAQEYLTLMRVVSFGNREPFFIKPHRDSTIIYRVFLVDGSHFRYVNGKLVGYEGELELVGLDLLASPPAVDLAQISHFASTASSYKAADLGIRHFAFSSFPGSFSAYRPGDQPQGWTVSGAGSGSIVSCSLEKAYELRSAAGITESLCGAGYSDFMVTVELCGLAGYTGLTFRRVDSANCYHLLLNFADDTITILRLVGGSEHVLISYPGQGLVLNRTLGLRLTAVGSTLAVFIRREGMQNWDYEPCGDAVEDGSFSAGRFGLYVRDGSVRFHQIRLRMVDGSVNYYNEDEIETLAHFSA